MSLAVVTFRWGDVYAPHYVERLASMVRRHCTLDYTFFCVSEEKDYFWRVVVVEEPPLGYASMGRCYRRMWIYGKKSAGLLQYFADNKKKYSRILLLDLDVVIVNSLDPILTRDDPVMLWRTRSIGARGYNYNPSFLVMDVGALDYVWQAFRADPWGEVAAAREAGWKGSDQAVLASNLRPPFVELTKEDGLLSWRDDPETRNPVLPSWARLVSFHGPTNQAEQRIPWVAEHWR